MATTKTLFALGAVLIVLAFASPATASGPACYTYDCVGQSCTFNATCSTATPIWRVWYDFGDGSTSGLIGPGNTSHTYATRANGGPAYPQVKLTVISWTGTFTVTCTMPVNQTFGPPLLPSGTCS